VINQLQTRLGNSSIAIVTVCSRAYLAQALTMIASIEKLGNGYIFNVFLTDLISNESKWLSDLYPNVEFYFLDEFADEKILENILLLTDLEFNTSLKPFALEVVIKRYKLKTFYCDSDLLFLELPVDAITMLNDFDILLTPHQLSHVSHGDDFAMVRTGIFNSGFIGLSGIKSLDFVQWWKIKTQNYCFLEPEDGIFVDQKWLDLAPILFENTKIFRHSGYNLGYWNIDQRQIRDEIIVMHLSGFSLNQQPNHSNFLSKYSVKKIPNYLTNIFFEYLKNYQKISEILDTYLKKIKKTDLLKISEEKLPTIKHRYLAANYCLKMINQNYILEPRRGIAKYKFTRLHRYETSLLGITRKLGVIFVKLGMSHILELLISIFRILGRRNSWLG
jgi:hypothetical protein